MLKILQKYARNITSCSQCGN